MDIKSIQRKRELKNNLRKKWYKLIKPLANYIDKREDKKYANIKNKAQKLTDEEAIDLVVKRIIKEIKKYGKFEEFIAVCSWSNEDYHPNIFKFISYINWNDSDRVLSSWCYQHVDYINPDINYIIKLTDILKKKLDEINGIKTEYYNEDDIYNWKYKNYIKTLKISLEE